MSIDTISNPRINIKELAFTEPAKKRELPFNPTWDIQQSDWNRVIEGMHTNKDRAYGEYDLFSAAFRIKILAPDKVPQFIYEQKHKDRIVSKSDDLWKNWHERNFLSFISFARILYPDMPREQFISKEREDKVAKDLIGESVEIAAKSKDSSNVYQALFRLANLKLFDRGRVNQFDHMQIAELAKSHCAQLLNVLSEETEQESVHDFTRFAPLLRILSPEKFRELNITDEHWKILKNHVDSQRKFGPNEFLQAASEISIIGASDIQFTDQGMQLVFDKIEADLNQGDPLPERRKF